MKLIEVIINGVPRRLSQAALDILGLEKIAPQNKPINIKKLPPNLEILKIQKAEKAVEPVAEVAATVETPAEPVVEVKKNEDVTVEKSVTKRRSRGKVGTKK